MMHGALYRNCMTGAVSKLLDKGYQKTISPTPEEFSQKKRVLSNGHWVYEEDLDSLYKDNPYFKNKVKEVADSFTGLQKDVPEDRRMNETNGYVSTMFNVFGNTYGVSKEVSLDELYQGNPYYKPAKA